MYSRFNDNQNPVEQHTQHGLRKVYVHRYNFFNLFTSTERYEYMIMNSADFPEHVEQQNNLQAHAKNGYIYLEIQRSIYGIHPSR